MPTKKKSSSKKWIGKMDLKKGALTATAKRAGALKKDGDIKVAWLKEKAKGDGVTAKRAKLALTFRKMKKK